MCSAGFTGDDVPRFLVQVEWQGSQRAVGGFTVLGQDHQGDRDCEEVLPRAVPLFALGGVGFGSLPYLDTKLTSTGCVCHPSWLRRVAVWWWIFTPGGAYVSVWVMVKPLTGNISSIISSTMSSLGVFAC